MASFQFWWSEKVYFPSIFERKFQWVWSFKVVSFHSYNKAVAPLSSGLDCFQQEVCCYSYLLFSVHNLSFHSTFIGLQQFDYDMAWRSFLYLLGIQWDSLFFSPCLRSHWGFWFCRFIIFIQFRKILVIISSIIFFLFPLLFPPCDTNYTCVDVVPRSVILCLYFSPDHSLLYV